jgi:hypothetical protein
MIVMRLAVAVAFAGVTVPLLHGVLSASKDEDEVPRV